jgi:hypothetical protein
MVRWNSMLFKSFRPLHGGLNSQSGKMLDYLAQCWIISNWLMSANLLQHTFISMASDVASQGGVLARVGIGIGGLAER